MFKRKKSNSYEKRSQSNDRGQNQNTINQQSFNYLQSSQPKQQLTNEYNLNTQIPTLLKNEEQQQKTLLADPQKILCQNGHKEQCQNLLQQIQLQSSNDIRSFKKVNNKQENIQNEQLSNRQYIRRDQYKQINKDYQQLNKNENLITKTENQSYNKPRILQQNTKDNLNNEQIKICDIQTNKTSMNNDYSLKLINNHLYTNYKEEKKQTQSNDIITNQKQPEQSQQETRQQNNQNQQRKSPHTQNINIFDYNPKENNKQLKCNDVKNDEKKKILQQGAKENLNSQSITIYDQQTNKTSTDNQNSSYLIKYYQGSNNKEEKQQTQSSNIITNREYLNQKQQEVSQENNQNQNRKSSISQNISNCNPQENNKLLKDYDIEKQIKIDQSLEKYPFQVQQPPTRYSPINKQQNEQSKQNQNLQNITLKNEIQIPLVQNAKKREDQQQDIQYEQKINGFQVDQIHKKQNQQLQQSTNNIQSRYINTDKLQNQEINIYNLPKRELNLQKIGKLDLGLKNSNHKIQEKSKEIQNNGRFQNQKPIRQSKNNKEKVIDHTENKKTNREDTNNNRNTEKQESIHQPPSYQSNHKSKIQNNIQKNSDRISTNCQENISPNQQSKKSQIETQPSSSLNNLYSYGNLNLSTINSTPKQRQEKILENSSKNLSPYQQNEIKTTNLIQKEKRTIQNEVIQNQQDNLISQMNQNRRDINIQPFSPIISNSNQYQYSCQNTNYQRPKSSNLSTNYSKQQSTQFCKKTNRDIKETNELRKVTTLSAKYSNRYNDKQNNYKSQKQEIPKMQLRTSLTPKNSQKEQRVNNIIDIKSANKNNLTQIAEESSYSKLHLSTINKNFNNQKYEQPKNIKTDSNQLINQNQPNFYWQQNQQSISPKISQNNQKEVLNREKLIDNTFKFVNQRNKLNQNDPNNQSISPSNSNISENLNKDHFKVVYNVRQKQTNNNINKEMCRDNNQIEKTKDINSKSLHNFYKLNEENPRNQNQIIPNQLKRQNKFEQYGISNYCNKQNTNQIKYQQQKTDFGFYQNKQSTYDKIKDLIPTIRPKTSNNDKKQDTLINNKYQDWQHRPVSTGTNNKDNNLLINKNNLKETLFLNKSNTQKPSQANIYMPESSKNLQKKEEIFSFFPKITQKQSDQHPLLENLAIAVNNNPNSQTLFNNLEKEQKFPQNQSSYSNNNQKLFSFYQPINSQQLNIQNEIKIQNDNIKENESKMIYSHQKNTFKLCQNVNSLMDQCKDNKNEELTFIVINQNQQNNEIRNYNLENQPKKNELMNDKSSFQIKNYYLPKIQDRSNYNNHPILNDQKLNKNISEQINQQEKVNNNYQCIKNNGVCLQQRQNKFTENLPKFANLNQKSSEQIQQQTIKQDFSVEKIIDKSNIQKNKQIQYSNYGQIKQQLEVSKDLIAKAKYQIDQTNEIINQFKQKTLSKTCDLEFKYLDKNNKKREELPLIAKYQQQKKIKQSEHDDNKTLRRDKRSMTRYSQNNNNNNEKIQIFQDHEFPPIISSVSPSGRKYKQVTKFIRAQDIFPNKKISLFQNNTTKFNDTIQGSLGNCYILCALTLLAKYPEYIKSLFKYQNLEDFQDEYKIQMIVNGVKQKIKIDSFLPVGENNKLSFSQSDGTNLWVCIIEKAFAKINESYENIDGGPTSYAINVLTGSPNERLVHSSKIDNDNNKDQVWDLLIKSQQNFLLYTGTKSDSKESRLSNGLVTNHAYSILEVRSIKTKEGQERIIKLRNPWGHFEWNGDWSDSSQKWSKELKEQVKLEKKDDGIFWIGLDDYYRNFSFTQISYFNPLYKYSFLEIKNEKTLTNFTYNFRDDYKDIKGYFILHQIFYNKQLQNQNLYYNTSSISFFIFETDHTFQNPINLISYKGSKERNIFSEIHFKKRKNYAIFISIDILNDQKKDITLSFYTDQKVNLSKEKLRKNQTLEILYKAIGIIKDSSFTQIEDNILTLEQQFGIFVIFCIRNKSQNSNFSADLNYPKELCLMRDGLQYIVKDCNYNKVEKVDQYQLVIPKQKELYFLFLQNNYDQQKQYKFTITHSIKKINQK